MKPAIKTLLAAAMMIGCLLTPAGSEQIAGESPELERVLKRLDDASRKFKTTQANVVWDEYHKVINETDTEKGTIYFRREGNDVQMAVDFTDPDKKYIRYKAGKVEVYLPGKDEVDQYNPGSKNRAEVESYLVLGFGGSGQDLLKSYDVRFVGMQPVNGINTEELELIPKSNRLRSDFIARILLWIDPARGISVQQQFFEPGGSDYRLVRYSDIKIDQKIPDDVFKLKTTKKTKFVSPQG
jgi:outer membrane lipoprotein-sorting protein